MSDEQDQLDADTIKSQNYSRGHLKRFLRAVPKTATHLILEITRTGGMQARLIGHWPKEDVRPEMAEELENMVLAECEEHQASFDGLLTWMSGETRGVTKTINRRFHRLDDKGEPVLNGDATSLVVQSQSLLRDMAKQFAQERAALFGAVSQVLANVSDANAGLATQLGAARADAEIERMKRMEAEEALAAVTAGLPQPPTQHEVQMAQAQTNMMQMFAGALAQKMAGGGAPTSSGTPSS